MERSEDLASNQAVQQAAGAFCLLISCLMCCVCFLVLSSLRVRNVNMNPSPCATLCPCTAGLCPVTRMVTGETKVKGSQGRMNRLSVKHENPQNQQALVFLYGRGELVSQRGEWKRAAHYTDRQSSTGLSACQSARPWTASLNCRPGMIEWLRLWPIVHIIHYKCNGCRHVSSWMSFFQLSELTFNLSECKWSF